MNNRVINALRKIAAEDLDPWYDGKALRYMKQLPLSNNGLRDDWIGTYRRMRIYKGNHKPTVEDIRQAQAESNAESLGSHSGTKLYRDIRKHLIDYGRTKQYNFNNQDNPKPMPVFDSSKLNNDQRKNLRKLEDIQANNRRSNPYSNIG